MAIQQMLLGIGPGDVPFNLPSWEYEDSQWTVSNNDLDAEYSASSSYGHVITGALTDGTTYRFFLDHKDGSNNYGGWFFTDTTNPVATVPDQLTGNSMGARTDNDHLGAWGSYATANNVTAGSDAIQTSGWEDLDDQEKKLEFVVNRTADKVWVRLAGDDDWVGGGDPNNASSTPSLYLPDGGTIYFGCLDYTGNGYAKFMDS